jgi:hypothetical protein
MTWAPILAWSLVLITIVGIFVQLILHELRSRK